MTQPIQFWIKSNKTKNGQIVKIIQQCSTKMVDIPPKVQQKIKYFNLSLVIHHFRAFQWKPFAINLQNRKTNSSNEKKKKTKQKSKMIYMKTYLHIYYWYYYTHHNLCAVVVPLCSLARWCLKQPKTYKIQCKQKSSLVIF